MSQYQIGRKRSILKTFLIVFGVLVLLVGAGLFFAWYRFTSELRPVSAEGRPKEIVIRQGSSVNAMGTQLEEAGIIRSARAFSYYVRVRQLAGDLQAGRYMLSPSQSTQDITAQLTHGKVATQLVTILPGQRLDQIRESLVNQGFQETDVEKALLPEQYEQMPALIDKPKGNSLEGYLYPDSFQRTDETTPKDIIRQSLEQMNKQFTSEIKQKMAAQGLTPYEGLIIASIVEKEVVTEEDRRQAAQVFIKRKQIGMQLGSDITAFYGSELAGHGQDVTYDTPYNTRIHAGMIPTPVSNVSIMTLKAVAEPAPTDWVFFVSGDDGITHFSRTDAEHNELVKKYCIELCK